MAGFYKKGATVSARRPFLRPVTAGSVAAGAAAGAAVAGAAADSAGSAAGLRWNDCSVGYGSRSFPPFLLTLPLLCTIALEI